MDTSLRKNIAARDAALTKTSRVTRRVGAAAAAGSLVLMAGFAHLIPTHLPHLSVNGTNGGSSGSSGSGSAGTGSGTSSGNGAPSSGSGPSQVTSGGS